MEIGVHIGSGKSAWKEEPEEEVEVHRLAEADHEEPLNVKATTDFEPVIASAEDVRRRSQQKHLRRWTVGMAVGAVVLIVCAVGLAVSYSRYSDEEQAEQSPALTVLPEWEDLTRGNPLLTDSKKYFSEAERLLRAFADAGSPAEVLPLIRDAERVKPVLEEHWKPFGGMSETEKIRTFISAQNEVPSLLLKGTHVDQHAFEVFFNIEEDGRLLLDWEATLAIGDLMLDRMPVKKGAVEGATLRAKLKAVEFYTSDTPEDVYRSFQIIDPLRKEFAWGYVRRDSPLAATLSSEFQENSIVLEAMQELSGTFRVTGPMADGSKAFEITEMLHKGWVNP